MTTSAISNRSAAATSEAPAELAGLRPARGRQNLVGWGFMAPFLVLFVLFLVWPMVHGLYLSLTNQSLTGAGSEFIGFANYGEALTDPDMWRSVGNTVWFTVLSTIPLVAVALVMALLADYGLPPQWLWRLAFFMPYLLASTVVSLIWIWIYNPQLGLLNGVVQLFGQEPTPWLQDPDTAMISVVILTVWWTVGFNFLLYLAALQNIPEQQYEAAALDGAGRWRQLFSITIPQLGPTTMLILILQVLASLKVFDQIYQTTIGGPGGATRPAVQYIFEQGFTGFRFGYSSAISYIFFTLILIVAVIQFAATSRRSSE